MARSIRNGLLAALLGVIALPAAAQTDSARLARGRYLGEVVMACGSCHDGADNQGRPLPNMPLAGGIQFNEPPAFRAVAPNISQDRETGIGAWTDAQIVAALREGRRPDGTPIGPPMPTMAYRGMSEEDMAALLAWLRSRPAVKRQPAKSQFAIPLQVLPPAAPVAAPANDPVERGRYLAENLMHCMDCHTGLVEGRPDPARRGAPGLVLQGPWGAVQARNISSSREHGIGAWSDADILAAVTRGVSRDGRPLAFPMSFRAPVWRGLEQRDQRDLVAYLRSLPPQE